MRVPKIPSLLDHPAYRKLHKRRGELDKRAAELVTRSHELEGRRNLAREREAVEKENAEIRRELPQLNRQLAQTRREASQDLMRGVGDDFLREGQTRAMKLLAELADIAEAFAQFRAAVTNQGLEMPEAAVNHLDELRRDVPGSITNRFQRFFEEQHASHREQ